MKPTQSALGQAPIGKLLVRLALPTIVAQLVNLLYNLVDRVYIGHLPQEGSLALTALGLCFPIIMMVSAFASLVGAGGAPQAAIAMGRGTPARAQQILGNCFAALLLVAVFLTVGVQVLAEPLLKWIGASEETLPYALAYLRIYAAGTVFVQMALGMNPFITAQGFTRISMLSVVLGAVCNILLDPLFLFVFKLGVRGAALATVLSQAASAVWVLHFLRSPRSQWRLQKQIVALQRRILLPVLALGLSPFVMGITESAINFCFNSSLARYGGDVAVGTMTILSSVWQLISLPINGLTQGAQPIISFNYGARQNQRVMQTFYRVFAVCLLYATAFWLLIQCAPALFVRIFNADDPALLALGSRALRIYMGSAAIFSMQMACQGTFLALGQARISLFLACLRKVFLLIPLIYLLPHLLPDPVMAVFWAEPIADGLSALTAITLFCLNIRKILAANEAKNAA